MKNGFHGVYHESTRFLSAWELRVEGVRPFLLSSFITLDNSLLTIDLTNPRIPAAERPEVPQGTVHLLRSKFISNQVVYERLKVVNYGLVPVELFFSVVFDADYADIFEVRGKPREARGKDLPALSGSQWIERSYEGLDHVIRRTKVELSPAPAEMTQSSFQYRLNLGPKASQRFHFHVICTPGDQEIKKKPNPYRRVKKNVRINQERDCKVTTSNAQFNVLLNRCRSDLHMLISRTPYGLYPYAGIPWYSTVFGRDGIITALESMWINPLVARGVLAFLAANQATGFDEFSDAQPGKVLHELRHGEMAALGEIPFSRSYSTVDATPLFVILAAAYYRHTGDREFLASIWENIKRALAWADSYGDVDGDGFVEYQPNVCGGLVNQGWKDSADSIFHSDGRLAEPPIALCEVQGYVYDSKVKAAMLAKELGEEEYAEKLRREAEQLKQRFNETFWSEAINNYALALDKAKHLCSVQSSNSGHLLFCKIVPPERAALVRASLTSYDMFSGWGIRTLSSREHRFNPMSYHNGSIWPHDNAIIAEGLSRYGYKEDVLRITSSLFDASFFMNLNRLPELYCGFIRRREEGPTKYPVACSPQAWSSASVFQLIKACLGMTIDGLHSQILFRNPSLPPFIDRVSISNLSVGQTKVNMELARHGRDVSVNVTQGDGVEVVLKY